jgi:hypothetical protein
MSARVGRAFDAFRVKLCSLLMAEPSRGLCCSIGMLPLSWHLRRPAPGPDSAFPNEGASEGVSPTCRGGVVQQPIMSVEHSTLGPW